MTVEEIRLRRLVNQYLVTPGEKLTVIRDLCGVQAQFFPNAIHSLKIRCRPFEETTIGEGLVKNWTVRGTVHLFAQEDLPLFLHCNNGTNYRSNQWDRPSFWNHRSCWGLTPERQAFFSQVILDSLSSADLTREGLKEICRGHGMTSAEEASMFDPWGGGIRELCERGFLNYVVMEQKAFCLAPPFEPVPEEKAKLELARRYFTNFGPATIRDAMYFFRATAAQVKRWLTLLPVQSCACEGRTYYWIENGRSYDCKMPHCLFLAGFDQLMLGYEKKESLFLKPEHMRKIFNLAGIVHPAILLHGNVVGKWKKKDRRLTIELFEPLTEKDLRTILDTATSVWNDIHKIDINK